MRTSDIAENAAAPDFDERFLQWIRPFDSARRPSRSMRSRIAATARRTRRILPAVTAQSSRWTSVFVACATGRTIIESMFTCAGRVRVQQIASAMSSATSGSATPA